jgi:lysophospholipase L1-like esterase
MVKRVFLSLLVLCFSLVGFSADSLRMETYGDSLTAGFLANTSLKKPLEISEMSGLLEKLAFGFLQKNRELLKKLEANDKAWPYFLSENLKDEGKQVSDLMNLAISGSKSSGLLSQVQAGGATQKYTWGFFFVGHNDLCHVKGDEAALVQQFDEHLNAALTEWDRNHRNSVMFLIPTGPIYQLYPVLDNYVWFQSKEKTFRCQDAWTKYFPYCARFYLRYKKGELESHLKPRGDSLNQALSQMAHEWIKKSGRGNRFFYLEAQWPLPLQPEYFALDCYHIAEEGQRIFAQNILNALKSKLGEEF